MQRYEVRHPLGNFILSLYFSLSISDLYFLNLKVNIFYVLYEIRSVMKKDISLRYFYVLA